MTLRTRLDARLASLDGAYRASMDEAIAHLRRVGLGRHGKQVGERAPDFALPGVDAMVCTLSDLLSSGPVILSFFRGEWCSFCRLEMDALIEAQPRFAAMGAHLVMISPQGPTGQLKGMVGANEQVTVLRDPMNGVGLQYGLIFRMPDVLRQACLAVGVDLSHLYGSDAWFLPIPATYVIGRDGTIALAHLDPDFSNRLDPDLIVATLVELARHPTPA